MRYDYRENKIKKQMKFKMCLNKCWQNLNNGEWDNAIGVNCPGDVDLDTDDDDCIRYDKNNQILIIM